VKLRLVLSGEHLLHPSVRGRKNNTKCGGFLFIALQYVWSSYILAVTLYLHLWSICAVWYYYVLYPLLRSSGWHWWFVFWKESDRLPWLRFSAFFSVSLVRGYDNISNYSTAVSFHSLFNSLCINHFVIWQCLILAITSIIIQLVNVFFLMLSKGYLCILHEAGGAIFYIRYFILFLKEIMTILELEHKQKIPPSVQLCIHDLLLQMSRTVIVP